MRKWSSGFELNSASLGVEFSGIQNTVSVVSSPVRSGVYAGRAQGGASNSFEQRIESSNTSDKKFFTRIYIRIATAPDSQTQILTLGDTSGQQRGTIRLETNRTLSLYGFTIKIGSSSSALDLNTWYRIELSYEDNTGSGKSEIQGKLNGISFASTTTHAETGGVAFCRVGNVGAAANTDLYFDDWAINDDTGDNQNSFPGEGKIIHLKPSASGDNSDWTGTFADIDEVTPNDATDFISANVTDEISDFNIENTPLAIKPNDIISVVHVSSRFNRSGGSTPSVRTRIKSLSDGTVEESTSFTPQDAWMTHSNNTVKTYTIIIYDLPGASTDAWTKAALDTAQIGVKIQSGGDDNAQITTLWALVEYIEMNVATQLPAPSLPEKKILFILESRNPTFRYATENWDFTEITREINGSMMVKIKTDQLTEDIANAITDLANRLTIRIATEDTGSAGINYFSGFIPARQLNLKQKNKSVEITAFGFASRLFDIPYRDGTTINIDKTAGIKASDLVEDVIDKAIVLDAQLPLTYDATTIDDSVDTIKDKFILQKAGDVLNRAVLLAFNTDRIWHWFIDGDNKFYFKKDSTSADHQFVYGKHITEFPQFTEELSRSINEVLVVYNGGANIKRVIDADSIAAIGLRSLTVNETNVPDVATATEIANAHLASRIPPIRTITVTIGADYPIESVNPGHTCRLDSMPSDIAALLTTNMFIVRTTYRKPFVDLVLSLKHPFISNQVDLIRRRQEKESVEGIGATDYA